VRISAAKAAANRPSLRFVQPFPGPSLRWAPIVHAGASGRRTELRVFVYKSSRRGGTYVFLRERAGLDRMPAALRESLAPFEPVMDFDLLPDSPATATSTAP